MCITYTIHGHLCIIFFIFYSDSFFEDGKVTVKEISISVPRVKNKSNLCSWLYNNNIAA